MKKLLPLVVLASTSAFAQDLQLSDLNFFQKKSSVLVNTAVNLGTSESKSGDPSETDKGKSTVWSNSVTYGLSDKLNVGLAFDYALKNETKEEGSKAYDDKGLSDFTITGAYRLKDSGTYVDLIGGLTIGTGDKEFGAASDAETKSGNFNQGHSSLNVGVAAGQKINSFEWRSGLIIDHHTSGDIKSYEIGSEPVKIKSDSFTDYVLFGQGQYRMDKFVVGLNLNYRMNADRKLKPAGEDKATVESHSVLTTGVTARYDLSSTIVLNAGYSMVNSYDIDTKEADGSKTVQKDNKASVVSVGATLLF
jgi:hypothetical protein